MKFGVVHKTEYRYKKPAAEAYLEARLRPPLLATQTIHNHRITIDPAVPTSFYTDHHGNGVDFFSIPFRHNRLVVTNRFDAETKPLQIPEESMEVSVGEARQVLASRMYEVYPLLAFTEAVTPSRKAFEWAARHLREKAGLQEAVVGLNRSVYRHFRYESGSTDLSTPLSTVWRRRTGVCQDFAHLVLSILRHARLPCRYVCGYIETDPPAEGALVGSVATHAWVEVLLPGMHWLPIDPTNNQICGERHIAMAFGADFHDAAPVRGTFKGIGQRDLRVSVQMKRRKSIRNQSRVPAEATGPAV